LTASLTLGKVYNQLHQWRPARLVLEQALAVTPDSAHLHFSLAETLMEQGIGNRARSHLEKVIRLEPQHGPAWYRLGQVYEHKQKSRRAIHAYRRAIQNLPPGTIMYRQAQTALKFLDPELPTGLASGWLELFRQMLGPVLICLLVALLDAGLRPWWITEAGWGAVFLGILGAFLWISGTNLPQNPAVQLLTGEDGIASRSFRMLLAGFGGFFWLFSLAFFLLPLGQTYPELPQL
jgi:tetratricopeptide (TPR) repeat protein